MLNRIVAVVLAAFFMAGAVVILNRDDGDSPESYVGTYRSSLLPAASSPGRIIVLEVRQDGSAVMKTDFQNNEPPISQEGQWVTDAGALVVTFSTTNGNPLFRPIRVHFLQEGGTIHTVGSEAEFGSQGLTLTKQ
jgi:hypothetical protein